MSTLHKISEQVEAVLEKANPSRRSFLRGAGMLVVSAGPLASLVHAQQAANAVAAGPYIDPDYHQLDSWIAIHPDNTATFYVGKTDLGQGTGTAYRQMMADELDMGYDQTSLIMGSTDVTVDQGGSGGSDGVQTDGWPMRRAAAEARRVLLEMGAQRLGIPVDQLAVANAVITAKADASKRVTYGELIGNRKFNVTLTGNNINATTGKAPVKAVQDMKVIGTSPLRYDVPPKVDGTMKWATGVKVPGMVHARNVRPPFAGAKLRSADEASVKDLPGFIKLVTKGNYVAVVCEREEQAIDAARRLKTEWEKPATAPFPSSENLFKFMRAATPVSQGRATTAGDVEAALKGAAKVVEAEYDVPFQGHTAFGPAHAMADPTGGLLTIYSNDMKSYGMRNSVADFLGMPKEQVRVVWMEGPQAYGRTAADDAGFEAAYLAKELGRPVRVQWMRDEETAWDTKGPAYTFKMRGGLDTQGNLIAFDYDSQCLDHNHVGYNEPDTVLISQLMGRRPRQPGRGGGAVPDNMYVIPNLRMKSDVVSLPVIWETPLRTGNLRDPNGPQTAFACESFIDEMAHAAGADPVEFRLKLLRASNEDDNAFRRARSIACVKAAANTFGWQPRVAAQNIAQRRKGNILTGRGIGYTFRSQTVVAVIAEVEVNRETGRVWVKRLVGAHDCGLVINPLGLKGTLECGMLYGLSRALHEDVRFDEEKVLSRDWVSHPSLTHLDTPDQIDIVIVNGDPNPDRPDLPHYGAGEAVIKPVMAAVGNAVFDATGVRLRRVPLRAERVLAALDTARV